MLFKQRFQGRTRGYAVGMLHVEYNRPTNIRKTAVCNPGIDTRVIFSQITGLPLQPRHRVGEIDGMLAGSGTYLEYGVTGSKLRLDHLEYGVSVSP